MDGLVTICIVSTVQQSTIILSVIVKYIEMVLGEQILVLLSPLGVIMMYTTILFEIIQQALE